MASNHKKTDRPRRERIIIGALYVLLLAGGVWHALGWFQTAMRLLAAPMIFALCMLLCYEYLKPQRGKLRVLPNAEARASRRNFVRWGLMVVVFGFLLEWLGVQSGVIFGDYSYGATLAPQLGNVPIVIGCAWLIMLLGSAALAQRIAPQVWRAGAYAQATAIAALMVLFDVFMEPAAMKLEYWQWHTATIPFRNFAAWGVFGGLLAFWGARRHVFPPRVSTIPLHAYIAQLGYFLIVNWA